MANLVLSLCLGVALLVAMVAHTMAELRHHHHHHYVGPTTHHHGDRKTGTDVSGPSNHGNGLLAGVLDGVYPILNGGFLGGFNPLGRDGGSRPAQSKFGNDGLLGGFLGGGDGRITGTLLGDAVGSGESSRGESSSSSASSLSDEEESGQLDGLTFAGDEADSGDN